MTRRFILRTRAEHDYESQRAGLGDEFLAALRQRLEAIRSFPELNPLLYRDIRRAVVSRFPYLFFMLFDPRKSQFLLFSITRAIPPHGHASSPPFTKTVSAGLTPRTRLVNRSARNRIWQL